MNKTMNRQIIQWTNDEWTNGFVDNELMNRLLEKQVDG